MSRSKRLTYAFGHLVSGYAYPENAHAGDSIYLAHEVLEGELGVANIEDIEVLAEHVAQHYEYRGVE